MDGDACQAKKGKKRKMDAGTMLLALKKKALNTVAHEPKKIMMMDACVWV